MRPPTLSRRFQPGQEGKKRETRARLERNQQTAEDTTRAQKPQDAGRTAPLAQRLGCRTDRQRGVAFVYGRAEQTRKEVSSMENKVLQSKLSRGTTDRAS